MAVETKIGLVVGLGFIVCFGVILQHRGSGDRLSSDVALELLNRHREPAADSKQPRFEKFTRSNPGDGRTISALPNRDTPVEQPRNLTTNSRPPAAQRDSDAGGRKTQPARTPATRPTQPSAKPSGSGVGPKPNARPLADSQTAKPHATSPAYEALFGEDDPANHGHPAKEEKEVQVREHSQPPARRAPTRRPKPAPKENRTYVVKSGDSLWGIAEQQYGRASRKVVDALYAANRGRMSSPGVLSVGMRLILPAVGDAAATARTRHAPAGGAVRFYQVQKGDRYTTIAGRFLGAKSRWKELYELNKDVFPDAGRIRPGVRIRLPATVLADAG